jgi:non-lysosomal glucosylceramidase
MAAKPYPATLSCKRNLKANIMNNWPVLKRYEGEFLRRVALPLGGIGTGTVSLGGRGDLRDWEIVNRPAKGFTPPRAFFALWAQAPGKKAVTRCLEGQISPEDYEGGFGCALPNHSLPRFHECTFEAAYPFGQVVLADRDVPLRIRLQAFNPMVLGDANKSGLPLAVLRFVVTNPTRQNIRAAICGSVPNFIGSDGSTGKAKGNKNEFRGEKIKGVFLSSQGVAPDAEQWGTLALATTEKRGVSHRTAWAKLNWGDSLLDFWDDFSDDGALENRQSDVDDPTASLCVNFEVPARGEKEITFLIAWHFPHRKTWTGPQQATIGNYYTTQWENAWEIIEKTAPRLAKLEDETLRWVNAFYQSDVPDVVKEAALFNASTLRTQTCFRTPDGRFWGWEGCGDKSGCCHGSCTHVWNYEQATAFLFGELSRSMREIEFAQATREQGRMDFRVDLPLLAEPDWKLAAADGQMGCVMKLYRDWQLSGDDQMLRALWPKAKQSLEFCWIPGGWDADRDGVMEGCQHNTMDVEYYGPNPQMGTWYLGALRAGEEMAGYLGDAEFAGICGELFEKGSAWLDANLFNGEYYEHEIRPPHKSENIAFGLRHENMGAQNLDEPELQLGAGCLIDQLVGQYFAHVCGLRYLLKPKNIRATLKSLMKYNFQSDFSSHFNHMRSYVLGDESAMLMATYPRGRRPKRPFPYYNEVMTGFEYTAAAHMIYEGQIAAGLKVIEAIRARYDGRRRNPFNEAECGHHYARAMASWAAYLAITGFEYSAPDAHFYFAPSKTPATWFWSNGDAWGTFSQTPQGEEIALKLKVEAGTFKVQNILVRGTGEFGLPRTNILKAGQSVSGVIKRGAGTF